MLIPIIAMLLVAAQDINNATCESCVHGTCTPIPNNYICRCNPGWNGRNCSIRVEDRVCQKSGLCDNGGTCQSLQPAGYQHGYFKCICPRGFQGKHCEIAVCKPGLCSNNGSCSVEQGGLQVCKCADGFSGNRCETKLKVNLFLAVIYQSKAEAPNSFSMSFAVIVITPAILSAVLVLVVYATFRSLRQRRTDTRRRVEREISIVYQQERSNIRPYFSFGRNFGLKDGYLENNRQNQLSEKRELCSSETERGVTTFHKEAPSPAEHREAYHSPPPSPPPAYTPIQASSFINGVP